MKTKKEAGNLLPTMNFKGNEIAFELNKNNEVKVNVTAFAKCFPGKNLSKIVNSQEISEYTERLSKITNVSLADLLEVRQGGTPGSNGTWANRKVALRIAQKLNVNFAIVVDMKIEELMFGKANPLAIQQEGILVENQIFQKRLGNYSIPCYYTNGQLYARMSRLISFVNNMRSWGKHLLSKVGEDNIVYVSHGKGQIPFGNYQAFKNYLSKHPNDEFEFNKINMVSRDIWKMDLSDDSEEPWLYRYTGLQMLEILELILEKPISKEKVIDKLKSGKIEEGGVS